MNGQILKIKLKQQAKNLAWRAITTVILTLTVIITVWVYAAFVEPLVGPNSSDQDFLQNILGANDANNDFDSSTVVSNNDGSIIERLEYLWANRASFMANVTNLDATVSSRLATASYTAERGTDAAALASDYTAARATKIDNLNATVDSRLAAASYTAERGTDSAALASNYTSTRAGYLDRLASTCGNSVVELGEGCDDGGISWSSGTCAGDCSKKNYWVYPKKANIYIFNDTTTASEYCYEHGFNTFSNSTTGSNNAVIRYYQTDTISTTGWVTYGTQTNISEIWCYDN